MSPPSTKKKEKSKVIPNLEAEFKAIRTELSNMESTHRSTVAIAKELTKRTKELKAELATLRKTDESFQIYNSEHSKPTHLSSLVDRLYGSTLNFAVQNPMAQFLLFTVAFLEDHPLKNELHPMIPDLIKATFEEHCNLEQIQRLLLFQNDPTMQELNKVFPIIRESFNKKFLRLSSS